MRKVLNWTNEPFDIPQEVYEEWDAKNQGILKEEEWNKLIEDYSVENSEQYEELKRVITGELPEGIEDAIYKYVKSVQKELPKLATRTSSQKVLNVLGPIF